MRKIITVATAVENCLSADYRNGNRVQKIRNVFRKVSCVVVGVWKNIHFDKFSCFKRIGEHFQKIVGDATFADLRNRGHGACHRFKRSALFACDVFSCYHNFFSLDFFYAP